MTARDKTTLKSYFKSGEVPNQSNFEDLIDSIPADVISNPGTVTSIATTAPITGGPITESGTIGISAATPSLPGSMSASDKTKLNSITGTNTGDQTLVGLGGIAHSLATVVNDFLVASGAGVFVKKTLAETVAILRGTLDSIYALSGHTHNLTGNVTSVGLATTIANDVVTNARMANMGANTIKGAVGAGDPVDLTVAQVRTMIGAGSGNGLDADTLDTLQATAFERVLMGSVTSDFNLALTQGEYSVANGVTISNAPYLNSCYGKLRVMVSDGTTHNNSSNWIYQFFDDVNAVSWVRLKVNSSAWTAWGKVWTAHDDGAGSGLDADMVDGYQPDYSGNAFNSHLVTTDPSGRLLNSYGIYDDLGVIEIGRSTAVGTTPFIDFHYGEGSPGAGRDFNFRIINNGDNYMAFQGRSNPSRVDFSNSRVYVDQGFVQVGQNGAWPIGPVDKQLVFRPDLGWWCYWDATAGYWLTAHEYQMTYPVILNLTTTGSFTFGAIRADYQFYATKVEFRVNAAGTQNASNYWGMTLRSINAAYNSATTLYANNTQGVATGTYVDKGAVSFSPRTNSANRYFIDFTLDKAGSPGNINNFYASFYYRLIIP